jgi:hypothetical protein
MSNIETAVSRFAEGFEAAKEKKLLSTTCPKFVQDAAEILEEMLPVKQE